MALRHINWTISSDMKLTPTAVQDAGVQGEHKATAVIFTLPEVLTRDYTLSLEYVNTAGGVDGTDALVIQNGNEVRYDIPKEWTQHGGEGTIRLVARWGSVVAYSFTGRVRFSGRAGLGGKIKSIFEKTLQGYLATMAQLQRYIGDGNTVAGDYSVAFGCDNTVAATCTYGFGAGYHNRMRGPYSVAIGGNNYTGYLVHNIIGYDPQALTLTLDSNAGTLAVGDEACILGGGQYKDTYTITAINGNQVTIDKAPVDSAGSTMDITADVHRLAVFGKPETGTNASGEGQMTFGLNNSAIGDYSILFGKGNNAAGSFIVCMGEGNEGNCYASVMLGRMNVIRNAVHAVAAGHGNKVYADFAAALGQQHTIRGGYGFAAGFLNEVLGRFSAAIGRQLITTKEFQVAVGAYNAAEDDAQFTVGIGTHRDNRQNGFVVKKDGTATLYAQGTGDNAVARRKFVVDYLTEMVRGFYGNAKTNGQQIGENSNTVNNLGTAIGGQNTVNGTRSFGCGYNNTVTGPLSAAFGERNTVGGAGYNFAAGFMNEVIGKFAAAFGRGLKLTAEFQTAVGAYNAEDAAAQFMVGIGSNASNRKTAFAVKKDGSATVAKQGDGNDAVVRRDYLAQVLGSVSSGAGFVPLDFTEASEVSIQCVGRGGGMVLFLADQDELWCRKTILYSYASVNVINEASETPAQITVTKTDGENPIMTIACNEPMRGYVQGFGITAAANEA